MINPQSKIASSNFKLFYKLLNQNDTKLQTVNSGFTLTELIVVVVITAILFGIAAPSWFAFMSRQRVNGAQTEVLQALREAQNLAITKRSLHNVGFTNDATDDGGAQASISTVDSDNNANLLRQDTLGQRDGGSALLQVRTLPAAAPTSIQFKFDGSVDLEHLMVDTPPEDSLYKVVISPAGQTTPRTCVIVDTILGSMREGKNDECNA